MCMMTDKLRRHAKRCKLFGQRASANAFLHAAEWVQIQNLTISEQRLQIRALQKLVQNGERIVSRNGGFERSYESHDRAQHAQGD